MSFVHLHNHTHYSLLDGLTKIDELIEKVKEEGMEAIAITDHGTMYGVIEFYEKCKKAGIKPIIGVETYLAPKSRFDKNTREDARNFHILLLAKNDEGYKNLIKLVAHAHLEGFYYKPRIDWELLQAHHEGLIACTACMGGEIPQAILAGDLKKAEKRILEYNELFGQNNFYLEIQDHPELEGQETVNQQLIAFSKKLNIPLVATNDTHYLRKEDYEAQDILLCLQNKKKIDDTDRMSMAGTNLSLRPAHEMIEAFKETPEAVTNTLKIAEACNVEIKLGDIQLPYFEVPEGYDGMSYLRELAEQGLKKRYGLVKKDKEFVFENIENKKTKEENNIFISNVLERMNYELEVVAKMGWPSYFLIVADFVNWAKNNKIVVGPGRGSAAGSLVCYLTGITNLDPLKYDLLFERFLNPERISMPDIDMDFADIRRDEVIRYVEDKYGKDHVAQIITFGTMAARVAVRDVGRVLNYPYDLGDQIAKAIPMHHSIPEAISSVPEIKEMYNNNPDAKRVLDYAQRLEGVARHSSTHACGVLITKNPLTDYVPVQYASSSDKTIVSQYSLHPIEDLGLLKMDFLGLKNLTIIESALKIIKNTQGLDIDIDTIPIDNKETYELFQRGETTGVFQFESSGMKRYLRELKPTEFEDIIAMVSLYRPGPMEWIPDYIAGKHKKKQIAYLHPKLEKILDKTYGVAIYQEQVMQIARDLAGFTMGEADVLRKAMGKKIAELLAKQKEKFIDGCVKNSVAKELAEKVFSFIEPFAGYGFNRSHAACYALIGYQTAYLKAHWPTEFMAALLTSDQGDTDRVAIEIEECRNMGIQIMAPDINESFGSFTVVTAGTKYNKNLSELEKANEIKEAQKKKEENNLNQSEHIIRFGLKAIKNIGEHIADVVIEERKENGPYLDLSDFLERITDKDLNKKSLESLIKCGALDHYGERGQLLANMDRLLQFNKDLAKNKDSKQVSLFVDAPISLSLNRLKLESATATDSQQRLAWEKELLGLYVSEHPFNSFKKNLASIITPFNQLSPAFLGSVAVAGVVSTMKKIITRNNQNMLFAKIEDAVSSIELLIFPRTLEETKNIWQEGKVVLCWGKLSNKDQEIKLLVDKVTEITLDGMETQIAEFRKKMVERPRFNSTKNGAGIKKQAGDASSDKQTSQSNSDQNSSSAVITGNPLKLILKVAFSASDLELLRGVILQYPGTEEVYFKITQNGSSNIVKTGFKVENSSALKESLINSFDDKIEVVGN